MAVVVCDDNALCMQLQAVVGVDNGGNHHGTTDRSRQATQSRLVVDNSSRSTCRRLADPHLLRPRRLSALDRRLEAVRRQLGGALRVCDVRRGGDVLDVVDRRGRRHDARRTALHPRQLYDCHHCLPCTS